MSCLVTGTGRLKRPIVTSSLQSQFLPLMGRELEFDIIGTVDTEIQEPCYINYEKVVGFTTIPKIITDED